MNNFFLFFAGYMDIALGICAMMLMGMCEWITRDDDYIGRKEQICQVILDFSSMPISH